MAEQVRRINDKGTLANGTASTNMSQDDILLMQHITGDGKDYKVPISQATAIPYGTTGTAAATAEKVVTLSNYPATYTVTVGSKVLVKFTYANTASSQMKLKVGSQASAYPCKCRGVNMMSGCVKAGAIVEFTFTGAEWNCQFCENDSAINSALSNYHDGYHVKKLTLDTPSAVNTDITYKPSDLGITSDAFIVSDKWQSTGNNLWYESRGSRNITNYCYLGGGVIHLFTTHSAYINSKVEVLIFYK